MLFALVLILSAPSRAMSMKHDFHMEQIAPVVRVPEHVLDAAGGDADCVVYQELERQAEPTDPIIVRCPDALGNSVLAAARKWKLTVDHGRLHVFEIIMVRAEAKTTTKTEAPPIPHPTEDVTRPRFVPTVSNAPAYPLPAWKLSRELRRVSCTCAGGEAPSSQTANSNSPSMSRVCHITLINPSARRSSVRPPRRLRFGGVFKRRD